MADIQCRWEKLNLVRVYTKPKGKLPDYSSPVVLRANKCTIEDFVSTLLHHGPCAIASFPVCFRLGRVRDNRLASCEVG